MLWGTKISFNIIIGCLIILICENVNGQKAIKNIRGIANGKLDNFIKTARTHHLGAALLLKEIAAFNDFPNKDVLKQDSIFYLDDSVYSRIPFKLFIPQSYNPAKPVGMVLLLHGATGASKFQDGFNRNDSSEVETDPFINHFRSLGFVVIMPYADRNLNFSWVKNKRGSQVNLTFKSLINLVKTLKRIINVDDSRVYAFGHSDGSDGSFGLDVFTPSIFAGFVAYNSMLTNLFANNIYLQNTVNRPIYIVHSDLDDLRPIQQTRAIIKILDSIKTPVVYKEYIGFKHEDTHLAKDFPSSIAYLDTTLRKPYSNHLYWETDNKEYSMVDWIKIQDFNLALDSKNWTSSLNLESYNKLNNTWENFPYYGQLNRSAVIKASFDNNTFSISSSRVTKLQILISPQMVDLTKKVKVIVNNKIVFNEYVKPDYNFELDNFSTNYDRKAAWINYLTINVD